MHTASLIQRHAALFFIVAAAAILIILVRADLSEPSLLSAWAIAQGIGIVWIGSGAWQGRERWAVRAQVTFVGIAIIGVVASQQDTNVAAVGLLVFMAAVLLLHFAHIFGQSLSVIRDGLTTIRGFSRVEAARQSLFFVTFAGPVALTFAPNVIGLGFLILATLLIRDVVARRTRQRLAIGLAREAADE